MTARVRVPELLNGPFTGLIVGTFGADLSFAERQVFRYLSPSTRVRVILGDARQMARSMSTATFDARRVNRTYIAAGVRTPKAWHPKFLLLVGPETGRLLVGSGNLSIPGYTGPGECFTAYDYDSDDPNSVAEFTSVVRSLRQAAARQWIDKIAARKIDEILESAPWILQQDPERAPRVRDNLERSHLSQLVELVAGRTVDRVIAAAPFHDSRAQAIQELLTAFSPAEFDLVVQDGNTSLPADKVQSVLDSATATIRILDASTPKRFPPSYLHTKFVIVKTSDQDFLLQGSPNLSTVALTEHGDSANFEMVNLLEGEPGAFDHLIGEIDTAELDDLSGFNARDIPSDETDIWGRHPAVHTVTWRPPQLRYRLDSWDDSDPILPIRILGTELAPVDTDVTRHDDGSIDVTLTFTTDTAETIEQAQHIDVLIAADEAIRIYPYHANTLSRVSVAGRRTDLLTDAGSLDLDDAELSELVAELERVLVIDPQGLWRVAHPTSNSEFDDETAESIDYADIDWETLATHPTMHMYRASFSGDIIAETELGITLRSLTDRFRIEVQRSLNPGAGIILDDELFTEPDSEDEDEADDLTEDEVFTQRQAPTARARRIWKNFIGRFIRGIESPDFVESVGPTVVLPTFVVFEHLCRRLRVLERINLDFLLESQIRMWEFMWGTASKRGYLSTLSEDEQAQAQIFLSENDHVPAFIASLDDALTDGIDHWADAVRLRDTWHAFLTSSHWQYTNDTLTHAAAVSLRHSDGPDIDGLAKDLFVLANYQASSEYVGRLATALGTTPSALEWTSERIMRSGKEQVITQLAISDPRNRLSVARAIDALNLWRNKEPTLGYYRIATSNALAYHDDPQDEAVFYNKKTRTFETFEFGERGPSLPWEKRLNDLVGSNDIGI